MPVPSRSRQENATGAGSPSVVIAAGGTGGHIFPGLALADAVVRRAPAASVSFVGTARGLEGSLIPPAGHRLHLLDMVPFAGADRLRLPAALVKASWQARGVLHRERADVAVGMGGYASIPLIVGARLARVPSLIHESGAVPGKANLVAARLTGNVATALAEATPSFPSSTTVRTVGMPLGAALADFDRNALRTEARAAYSLTEGTSMLLVNGGSQGAASLNRLALGLAERWRGRHDLRIVLKAGARQHEAVAIELTVAGLGQRIELVRFIERMDHAYAAADMTVCRAGAGTVAELAVVELPAVLVPYPHAPSDHQTRNARAVVDAGGGLLVPDHQATAEVVGPLLEARLGDESALAEMRAGLRSVAHPHAADELAAWVLELAGAGVDA